jgi:NADP-dependent 3-hydroxy acid dehydrogenase YdfG
LPKELQDIDILVNNAGHDVGGRRRFDEGEIGEWRSIIGDQISSDSFA